MRTTKGTGGSPKHPTKGNKYKQQGTSKANNRRSQPKQNDQKQKVNKQPEAPVVPSTVDYDFFAPGTVWYEKFAELTPVTAQQVKKNKGPVKLDTSLILSKKIEAKELFDEMVSKFQEGWVPSTFYSSTSGTKKSADTAWMESVLRTGTASDKVAASIIVIQQAPIHKVEVRRHVTFFLLLTPPSTCLL